MHNYLYGFSAAFWAERLKLKGSRIILMSITLGIFFPVLFAIIGLIFWLIKNQLDLEEKLPYNVIKQNLETSLLGFGILFLPIALILITSRLASIEHKSDNWKLVETQPVNRFSFWLVKWTFATLISLFTICVFLFSSTLLTYILFQFGLYDKYAYAQIPFTMLFNLIYRVWFATFGIITVQLAISLLIRSTIWPIVIGVICLLITNIVNSKDSLGAIWPYTLTMYSTAYPEGSEVGYWLLPSEKQGLVWLLIIPLAFILFRYRLSLRHSFNNRSLWSVTISCIVLLIILTWWIQKPRSIEIIKGRTVIAGVIHAPKLPDSIELLKQPIGSQKVAIKKDGSFHFDIDLSSDIELLKVKISPYYPTKEIYAGNGDSVYLDWIQGNKAQLQKFSVRGTAVATNQYFENQYLDNNLDYYLRYSNKLSEPDEFYNIVVDTWKSELKKIKKFKTADGLGLSNPVREMVEKLITADILTKALFEFPEKKNIHLENSQFKNIREKLLPIQKKLAPFEEKLVGWKEYDKYLYKSITNNLPRGINEDSVFYAVIMKRPPGNLRNVLLFNYTKDRINESRDSLSRVAIMQEMKLIDNKDMQKDLRTQVELLDRLRKGKPAPFINLHNVNNESVNFSSLRGKFVLIDVWATWCAPCLSEAPIFERLSEKYRGSPIEFVSISIDDDLIAWQAYARKKKNRVMYWRALDKQFFTEQYGFRSIPHYILLDPEGNFINANLPYPSDNNFEILLRRELHLPEEEG